MERRYGSQRFGSFRFTAKSHRSGESGSNGLTLDSQGQLVLCQHGDRRVARMKASIQNPKSEFVTLAANYQGANSTVPMILFIIKEVNYISRTLLTD